MKKFFVAVILTLVCFGANAQIGEIKTEKRTWHFVGQHLFVDSNKCYLHVSSDNRYDREFVKIYLGNRYDAVINSLNNLITAIEKCSKTNSEFEIQGYTFFSISYSGALIYGSDIKYSAGTYKVTIADLQEAKENMKGWIDGKYCGGPSEYGETW